MTAIAAVVCICVVAALGILASRRPSLVLALCIAWLPVQLDTVASLGFRFAPVDVGLAALLLGIALRKAAARRLRPVTTLPLIVGAALLGWFALTLPHTYVTLGALPQTILVNKILGLALLLASYWAVLETSDSVPTVARLARWFVLTGSLWNLVGLAGYALWTWGGIANPTVYGATRLCGFLVDPNAYGGFLASVWVAQAALTVTGRRSKRTPLEFLNLGLLLLGTYLTYSRSAWLAAIVGTGVLLLVVRRHERRVLAAVGVLVALELAVLIPLTRGPAAATLTREVTSRVEVVAQASRSFIHSPIWGAGIGVSGTLPQSGGLIVHSTYFWLLADCGIVGLFIFLWIVLAARRQFLAVDRAPSPDVHACAVALGAALVAWLGFMIGIEGLYQRHFWYLAGALGALWVTTAPERGSQAGAPRVLQVAALDATIGAFILPLVDALRQNGYVVDCACADGPKAAQLRQAGYVVHSIQFSRRVVSVRHAVALAQLVRLMRRNSYEIVHVHTPIAAAIGRVAARLAGVRVVVYTAHGFYFHERMRRPLRRLCIWMERFLGRTCTDFLFAVSCEDEVTAVRERIVRRDYVLCLKSVGINLQRFDELSAHAASRVEWGLLPSDRVVCFVGRLVEEKGILDLVRAIGKVQEECPEVKLLVIGETLKSDRARATQRHLKRLLENHRLDHAVIFAGYRDDIPSLLQLADVFVLPSYREGMPVTILEAMAARKPVIATHIRGCREEVVDGKTGRLVPPGSPDALAEAILWVLADPERAATLGEAGRWRVEAEFREERVLDAQLGIYHRLLVRRTGSGQR